MTTEAMNAWGVLLQGIGTFLGAFAVIAAGYFGATSFEKWRKQKIEERKFEHAERIAIASYNARRELSYIRQPFVPEHELQTAEHRLGISKQGLPSDRSLRQRFITIEVYASRLENARDVLFDLQACIPIARAIFGPDLETALEQLGTQFNVIRSYLDIKEIFNPASDDMEFGKKMHAALTSGYKVGGNNEMDALIAEQFKTIENICLPVLRQAKN